MPAIEGGVIDQVRITDALDIAIVTVLLYVFFVWLRDRASRSFGIVAVGLALLFLLARWLDLYLTTMLFHYGLLGILLAMVVVFQQDMRNGFERLASSRWFRRAAKHDSSGRIVDTIVQSVTEMAEQRIGALLVFPGNQPLNRHVRGGVPVDARISAPLLLSIFHPESPGHDGAVLIESDRIAWLGVHLPLTTQVDKVHDSGTRHAAALGLAECCDALAVVVSEERGTITLACDGTLTVIQTADLAEALRQHLDDQHGSSDRTAGIRLADWSTGFAAITVAVMLWLLFAYRTDTIQRTFVVPIEYRNLPVGLEIAEPMPTYVEATLSGPESAFALLDAEELAVSLEIEETQVQKTMHWTTASNLTNVPADLVVENIVPESIAVWVRPKNSRPADRRKSPPQE